MAWISGGVVDPIVQTTHGAMRGRTDNGVSAFKGIPYAAPLDGIRRFQAPVPPEPWEGTRDAGAYSADPPQGSLMPGVPSPWKPRDGTDCLSVNVWTPAPGASALPVMVWIYGGAFLIGTARLPEYDAANLARGGVIVVSLNYRVGFEGFGWLPGAGFSTARSRRALQASSCQRPGLKVPPNGSPRRSACP